MAEDGLLHAEFSNGQKIAAGFKVAPAAMRKELRVSNKKTAKEAQRWIRSAAAAGTPQQRHMANGIAGTANSTQALIAVRASSKRTAGALGTFFGSKQFPQFPKWVGNNWTPATHGQGPYVINPTLAARQPEIETIYLQGQADALARAVPRS